MSFVSRSGWLLVIAVLLGLAACASKPKPPPPPSIVKASLDAQPSVNPDVKGRASPIIVRVYELKSVAAFNSSDFFSLFEREKETLGAELVEREEFQLQPGEKRQFDKQLQPETRYVGVVAAFRNLEKAQWRASAAIVPHQTLPLGITLEHSSVSIAVH